MTKASAHDTARRSYIRLLSKVTDSTPTKTDADTSLIGELIEAEFLTGGVVRDGEGHICECKETGITVEGRLFLQRLREEERQAMLRYKSLKYLPVLLGYIAGLLSPLISEWIKILAK